MKKVLNIELKYEGFLVQVKIVLYVKSTFRVKNKWYISVDSNFIKDINRCVCIFDGVFV